MKRILFDENLPRFLRRRLPEFEIRTVQEEGWGSLQNGALLHQATGNFDVLLTADRRMEYQQTLTSFGIGVVVIITPRLHLHVLEDAIPQIQRAIERAMPGEILRVIIRK